MVQWCRVKTKSEVNQGQREHVIDEEDWGLGMQQEGIKNLSKFSNGMSSQGKYKDCILV